MYVYFAYFKHYIMIAAYYMYYFCFKMCTIEKYVFTTLSRISPNSLKTFLGRQFYRFLHHNTKNLVIRKGVYHENFYFNYNNFIMNRMYSLISQKKGLLLRLVNRCLIFCNRRYSFLLQINSYSVVLLLARKIRIFFVKIK